MQQFLFPQHYVHTFTEGGNDYDLRIYACQYHRPNQRQQF